MDEHAYKPGISVVIITKNERDRLPQCIAAITDAVDEIIVVDSGSDDGTLEYAKMHPKIRLVEQTWLGYGKQKNVALGYAGYRWVLSLDADEIVSPQLMRELRHHAEQNKQRAFSIRRQLFFFGRRLRFGKTNNDWVTRFFRNNGGSFSENQIHETFVAKDPIRRCHGCIDHHSYRSVDDYFMTFNRYTRLMAEERYHSGRRAPALPIICLRPMLEFINRYFVRLGFLDGYYGFLNCSFAAFYHFVKWVKLREMQRKS